MNWSHGRSFHMSGDELSMLQPCDSSSSVMRFTSDGFLRSLEGISSTYVSMMPWLVVIEGGGWVGVGDERTRVAAGEAVLWPADIPHAAWTEHSEMRAFVIEFAGPDDVAFGGVLDGQARALGPGEAGRGGVSMGDGSLRPDSAGSVRRDEDEGEPA